MHIDASARVGSLPAAVMLDKGVLKITPIEKSTPPEAEALATRLYAMLPRIRSPISCRRWRDGRRWAPTFLDAFVFQGIPAAAALMRAIDMLRDMNRRAVLTLPKSAPISFVRARWARHVLRGGALIGATTSSACCRNTSRTRRIAPSGTASPGYRQATRRRACTWCYFFGGWGSSAPESAFVF